ncbi:unnamed protein product [Leptidea sinapis]|uniref:Uncharacterized protein n=1 Tax=Leptidea sinapis TaxID=189913 RepID=A0A5E4QWI3_9NEOP|nr:unnamed protein product [Leptidea sinapis]
MLSWRTFMKSTIDSTRTSIANVLLVYKDFCNETTLHGLKHTVAGNFHFVERLLWFVLTMGAFAGAVYCGLSQLMRYNSEPVVVSLQRDYRDWSFNFPAVTACFLERVDDEKAADVVEIEAVDRIKNLRPEQRRCQYPDEWLSDSIKAYSFGLCQMHCRSRLAVMFCGCRPYFHIKGGKYS